MPDRHFTGSHRPSPRKLVIPLSPALNAQIIILLKQHVRYQLANLLSEIKMGTY